MAEQFSSRTVKNPGGLNPEEWRKLNITGGAMTGDKMVKVKLADGTDGEIKIKDAAIVFKDLKIMREEDTSNRGGAPFVMGTPLPDLVSLEEAYKAWASEGEHKYIQTNKIGIVPLGYPTSAQDQIVFQQSARIWVSCGANDINMHDHHVGNMLMSTIQSICWLLTNEISQKAQHVWFDNLVLLVDVTNKYFKKFPESFKIVEPLRDADMARDMMARSIAFIFFEEKWSSDDLLRILEVILKRYAKHTTEQNFIKNPINGAIACLSVVPLLRDIIHGVMDPLDAVKLLNDRTLGLVEYMCDHVKTNDIAKFNKRFLHKLITNSDLKKVSLSQVEKLYDFCMNQENYANFAPFTEWGLCKDDEIPFDVIKTGFFVTGRKTMAQTKCREQDGKLFFIPATPADWSAFAIKDPGTYRLKPIIIGAATAGIGNTFGQVNVANMRFTQGLDILPKGREGMSSTGTLCRKKWNKWIYEDTKKTLDLSKDIVININSQKEFTIKQQTNLFYSGTLKDDPLLVAYKFLKFIVSFKPEKKPVKIEVRAAKVEKKKDADSYKNYFSVLDNMEDQEDVKQDNETDEEIDEVKTPKMSKEDLKDLTGNALMKKLAELSIKKDPNKEKEPGDKRCVVCYDKEYDCSFNCGHICVCMQCSNDIYNCPVCRAKILTKNKVYCA
jgi:hypothetical protein